MSTLNSSSTLEQINAAYDDNASYSEDNDVAKCKTFITACRMLLRRTPKRAGTRFTDMELNPDQIQREMERAQTWLEAHDTGSNSTSSGPRTTRVDFSNFRD